MTAFDLDLRGVKCPMNFVKTKLFMDKMQPDDIVTVLLDPGEPVESVISSIEAEGHQMIKSVPLQSGHFSVTLKKIDQPATKAQAREGLC